MRKLALVVVPALALGAAAGTGSAQQMEEEAPPVLGLSFFQCHSNQIGDVMEQAEAVVIPVWDELVAEGMVQNYGYFTHWWADEWNVGIYTIGESVDAIIRASNEAGQRIEARNPDAEDPMAEACPWHRDGFYHLGPSTGMDEEDEGAAGGG